MTADEILFLTPQDVRRLVTMPECIVAVEEAFRLHGEGKAVPPVVAALHSGNGGFHIKAGMLSGSRTYFAAKVNGNFPNNPVRLGLPTIQGLIILCDAENGIPLAVMDSREITSLRTAAATAIAAKHLARPESDTLTICGCGNQGRFQLAGLAHIFTLRTVFAFDQNDAQVSRFVSTAKSDLGISVIPARDLKAALRQ